MCFAGRGLQTGDFHGDCISTTITMMTMFIQIELIAIIYG